MSANTEFALYIVTKTHIKLNNSQFLISRQLGPFNKKAITQACNLNLIENQK